MSADNILTFHGRVGTKVELREGAVPWVIFRVASTPSYFDQATRQWRDLETTWISVKAWRSLAQNAAESLEVGDPIIVTGRCARSDGPVRTGRRERARCWRRA